MRRGRRLEGVERVGQIRALLERPPLGVLNRLDIIEEHDVHEIVRLHLLDELVGDRARVGEARASCCSRRRPTRATPFPRWAGPAPCPHWVLSTNLVRLSSPAIFTRSCARSARGKGRAPRGAHRLLELLAPARGRRRRRHACARLKDVAQALEPVRPPPPWRGWSLPPVMPARGSIRRMCASGAASAVAGVPSGAVSAARNAASAGRVRWRTDLGSRRFKGLLGLVGGGAAPARFAR